MSLINDALKQARQAPPRTTPQSLAPLQPIAEESSSAAVWIIPAVIIFLIVAAIFFIGWSAAHNAVREIAITPSESTNVTQTVDGVMKSIVKSEPEPPAPVKPPELPRLQGIFYSATAPSAILDGKTVRPGDEFKQFKVKEITKYTVVLTAQDKQEYQVGMGN